MRRFAICCALLLLLPSVLRADRPNVLIAISDDQSYRLASADGEQALQTPAFDRMAREGVLFTNAFVASPGCSPSRAAMLTGRYPWQIEQAGTHASSFPAKYVVFPELLEQAGYAVGYTGKGWGPGDYKVSGRSRNPAGPVYNKRRLDPPQRGISNVDYAANFEKFLKQRKKGEPFCFWYGAFEPHRVFDEGSARRAGADPANVKVPPYLPDTPAVRSDLLDYHREIECFDKHLSRMLAMLEAAGELDNTIVIVTSDNGLAFPRAKANCYEDGIHVPLAIRWPGRVPGGRVVDDPVSLIRIMPTLLEAAGVAFPSDAPPMTGKSLLPMLTSDRQGVVDFDAVAFAGRERHSSSRRNNLGYPQRCIRTSRYLYIRNFAPERWPAGAPQIVGGEPHGAYHDIDACPTLTVLVEGRNDPAIAPYFHLAVDKRSAEELYDIQQDPGCLNNLADDPEHASTKRKLAERLEALLHETGDPRVTGNGDIWESYPRLRGSIRKFPAE